MPHQNHIQNIMELLEIGGYRGNMDNMRDLLTMIYRLGRIDGNLDAVRQVKREVAAS